MNEFLGIVKERHNKTLTMDSVSCPYCESKGLNEIDHRSTLAGGKNHHWHKYHCMKCNKSFNVERKGKKKIWYTDSDTGRILRGIPHCFEEYIYTCDKCGGDIHRHYLRLDSSEPVGALIEKNIEGIFVKQYRIVFKCKKCGIKVQSENDFYYSKKHIKRIEIMKRRGTDGKPRQLKEGWTIEEFNEPFEIDKIKDGKDGDFELII